MKKYIYLIHNQPKTIKPGSFAETIYIDGMAKDGWRLTGPPVANFLGDWVYYWEMEKPA